MRAVRFLVLGCTSFLGCSAFSGTDAVSAVDGGTIVDGGGVGGDAGTSGCSGPCAPEQVVSGASAFVGIAVDGTNLYAVVKDSGIFQKKKVVPSDPLTELVPSQVDAQYITVVGGQLYWTSGSEVHYVAAGGGSPRVSHPTWANGDGTMLYGIAFGSGHAFVADPTAGAVFKVNLAGGTPEGARNMAGAEGVALDAAGNVWVTGCNDGTIYKWEGAPALPMPVIKGLKCPAGIAIDQKFIYVAEQKTGKILRFTLDGVTQTLLADQQTHPTGIALDATHVYWTRTVPFAVMRLPLASLP